MSDVKFRIYSYSSIIVSFSLIETNCSAICYFNRCQLNIDGFEINQCMKGQ